MSYYNERRGFVFLHNPKTAGTSIKQALYAGFTREMRDFDAAEALIRDHRDCFGNHLPLARCRLVIPTLAWDRMFIFMVARNPWARFVSLYTHRRAKCRMTYKGEPRYSEQEIAIIEAGFKSWLLSPDISDTPITHSSQMMWGASPSGGWAANAVLRFEEIGEEWAALCRARGWPAITLPHAQRGKGDAAHYREFYCTETHDHVVRVCAPEIQRLGYAF